MTTATGKTIMITTRITGATTTIGVTMNIAGTTITAIGLLRRPTEQRAERSEADMPGGKGRKKAWDRKRRTKEA